MTDLIISPLVSTVCKGYNLEKINQCLNFNIRGGKKTRYEMFSHVGKSLPTETKEIMGFIMELFHSSFLISDDIVDNSMLRRGKPCWYFTRGMMTLRDSRFFMALSTRLVDKKCLDVLLESFYITCMGQTLDTKNKSRDECTKYMYTKICEYKTSMYSVYMPLYCGYVLSNILVPTYLKEFSNLIGLIYQMNDDYLNFFPEKTKKTSNDLEEFKLTYFATLLNKEEDEDVEIYFRKEGIPPSILKKIHGYFDKYFDEKNELVEKSKKMIKKEDEENLMFCYDILKIYELN